MYSIEILFFIHRTRITRIGRIFAEKIRENPFHQRSIYLPVLCVCFILCGCITEYEATGIDEVADILVVEGVITDDETIITLSRSSNLTDDYQSSISYISNARISVECDDGTQMYGDPHSEGDGYYVIWRYTIKTGQLNLDCKYRLKIEIEEIDYGSDDCYPNFFGEITCPAKTYEYCSDYSYPIKTPEIDSIFWIKRGRGQPVMIHVATHSPDRQVLYYRWSYKEDWEINSDVVLEEYPYYCWNQSSNRDLLLGSAEKTVFGKVTEMLAEIPPSNRKLSVLYRINVRQNAISKRAYDYFANIKKNSQQSGSIFAPIPSELRGNIVCTTDPDRPVIGYVDVSTTTQKTRYISRRDNLYEPSRLDYCDAVSIEYLIEIYGEDEWIDLIPGYFVPLPPEMKEGYVHVECVDCTYYGTTQKPDDWPDNY